MLALENKKVGDESRRDDGEEYEASVGDRFYLDRDRHCWSFSVLLCVRVFSSICQ